MHSIQHDSLLDFLYNLIQSLCVFSSVAPEFLENSVRTKCGVVHVHEQEEAQALTEV